MVWLKQLSETLPAYFDSLQVGRQVGRYLPCAAGATRLGRQVSLGFSCFAMKLSKILNLWKSYPVESQNLRLEYIQSFQAEGKVFRSPFSENAFIDPAVILSSQNYIKYPEQLLYQLYADIRNPRQWLRHIVSGKELSTLERALIAETKQAIATLVEMGAQSTRIYFGFPKTREAIMNHYNQLDWSQPWGAGGQAAAIPVFIQTQATRFLPKSEVASLAQSCIQFFENIADRNTGAFFRGALPKHGSLVNGAMKVLTALDWLDAPIPYPGKLIDTVLKQLPPPDGCHLVDSIYVLYRCLNQVEYRRKEIQEYSQQVLEMIKLHYNNDGGFSYAINRSQTGYYGVRISRGLPESDLHGTILLTWAIAMILEILDANLFGWHAIRP